MVGLGGSDFFCHTKVHRGLPYRVMNNMGVVFGTYQIWLKLENVGITGKLFLRRFQKKSSVPKFVPFLIRPENNDETLVV